MCTEIVDWSQLSVQIRPKDLGSIDNILDTVTEHKYKQKLTQMHKVFHRNLFNINYCILNQGNLMKS